MAQVKFENASEVQVEEGVVVLVEEGEMLKVWSYAEKRFTEDTIIGPED